MTHTTDKKKKEERRRAQTASDDRQSVLMMIQSDGIIAEGWKKIREEVRSYSLSL
jgi:hypothetical protein